ncbi:MAG: hypothetical protein R6V12_19905 [Candidatus Hydrogenedentota bacterium]
MSSKRIYPLKPAQVFFLIAFIWGAPILAESLPRTAHHYGAEGAKARSEHRPDRQHYSPGTAEGVHFRRDVPTFRHEAGRISAKSRRHHSYVATGRSVILSGPGRVHHGHYYRRHRRDYRYPARSYWVPGYWKMVYKRVWIPGHWERRHIPPVYRREMRNGREVVILIKKERWERIWVEGRYETRRERVWIDGYWARRR